MHIAVCDDHIADRKQMERLLGREGDARRERGQLYFDSYGNEAAIFAHPMLYDVFFVDMSCTEGVRSLDIVKKLRAQNVTAPIVLCCGEEDYRAQDFPEGTLFLDKPIVRERLAEMLDHAQELKEASEEMIELRDEADTYYLPEAEILYAVEEKRWTKVRLRDGSSLRVYGNASLLFAEIEKSHPQFIMPTHGIILNCRHITRFRFPHRAVMTDGASFPVRAKVRPYAEKMQETYHDPEPHGEPL